MAEKTILRDCLALDRTHLANERTLLAYWRTALAFFGVGAILIKFFPDVYVIVIASLSLFFGLGIFVYGTGRFFYMRKQCDSKYNLDAKNQTK